MTELTANDVRNIARLLRECAVPLRVVRDEAEARAMTASDLYGHQWVVGERYFMVDERGRTVAKLVLTNPLR